MSEPRQPPDWSVLGRGEQHCSNPVPGSYGGAPLPGLFRHTPGGFVVFAPDRTVVGRAAPGADVAAVEVDEGGLLTAGGEGCGLLTAGQLAAVRAAAAPSSPPPPAPPPAPENVAAGGLSLPPMGAAPSR